jgi:hypothetical protein
MMMGGYHFKVMITHQYKVTSEAEYNIVANLVEKKGYNKFSREMRWKDTQRNSRHDVIYIDLWDDMEYTWSYDPEEGVIKLPTPIFKHYYEQLK